MRALGWNDDWARVFASATVGQGGLVPARVIEQRNLYRVSTGDADFLAVPSGRLRHQAMGAGNLPAAGDWLAVTPPPAGDGRLGDEVRATIHHVLPRRTCLSRKAAGHRVEQQVLAANVDTAFLMMGLGPDYNLRRLERYLAVVGGSGATPVVLLTKADLCPADVVAARVAEVCALVAGSPVVAVSAVDAGGLAAVAPFLRPAETVVLLGSSGVGKSTLINRLLAGDVPSDRQVQPTGAVREYDGRGRHTTTHRQLFVLPGGALLIDSPGLREIQLWQEDEALDVAFSDIETLAAGCRFRDCRHDDEPGCAVRAALKDGVLAQDRIDSFLRLRGELEASGRRQQAGLAARERRQSDRAGAKLLRKRLRQKDSPG